MLDINAFRVDKGGDPEKIRESQRRRFADVGIVDRVIDLDEQWRQATYDMESAKREANLISKEVGRKKKAGEDTEAEQEQVRKLKVTIAELEDKAKSLESARNDLAAQVGNYVHESVPVSQDEAMNAVVREWGQPRQDARHNHVDLVQMLGIANLDQGVTVAGGRGYYLMNEGCLLNQALVSYAMAFLFKRGYTPVQTPFFMRKTIMAQCAQLSQFDEELYHVSGEGEDKYLIATSEQTLCALHLNQWVEPRELPIKLAGYSTCFRKEAGSHGRDTLGIFRVHQFEKVEQFVVAHPDESWPLMEEMIGNAEAFYQSLGLPYRVVNIVSGELNNAAAKKYDLEAWFPGGKAYRELVSCSNCTDYQSRNLEVRLRTPKAPGAEQRKDYVHMLNATMTATERTLCCLLENYQTENGVVVPEPLRPYTCGVEFIPFRKEFDKNGKLVDRAAPKPDASMGSVN